MEKNSVYGNPLVYKIPEENSKKACRCLFERLCGHVPARVVLYFLSWSGFLVSFMMRTDINLAIVAMVHLPTPSALSTVNVTDEETYCYDAETLADHNSTSNYYEDGEFDWSNTVQSVVLGSFYWSYIVSQVVGGLATQRFGTKRVFGWAQLATAACSLAIPSAAVTHWSLLVVLRCAQGFASGLTWPAMYAVVGHWIPTAERSRFMSSFQGFSIGIGVTYPLCGFLIAHFGWRSVFYTTGSIGVLWCIVWYLLAFDSPESHPRISNQEKQYIADNTVNTLAASRLQVVPWRSIFTSIPAWSIGITTFGRIWVHYTFIIPGPMYMKTVLGFSIQENGLLSGAPFISSYLASVVFCWVADQWVTKKVFSLTNVRKIFTALSQVVPGILCILIGYMGCNLILVLIFWFIAVTLITAAYAGAMANIVDLSPNFAGPVLAFAQTIHMTASFCSPLAAGFLTRDGHTLAAWRNVFGTTAFVAIGTYVMYQIFGTGDVQPWNNPKMIVDPEEESTETEKMINGGTNTDTKTTNI